VPKQFSLLLCMLTLGGLAQAQDPVAGDRIPPGMQRQKPAGG